MRTSEKILESTLSSNKSVKRFKPRYRNLIFFFSRKHNFKSVKHFVPFFQPHPSQPLPQLSWVGEEEAAMELTILRVHIEDEMSGSLGGLNIRLMWRR
jgi:hypothetical protein